MKNEAFEKYLERKGYRKLHEVAFGWQNKQDRTLLSSKQYTELKDKFNALNRLN